MSPFSPYTVWPQRWSKCKILSNGLCGSRTNWPRPISPPSGLLVLNPTNKVQQIEEMSLYSNCQKKLPQKYRKLNLGVAKGSSLLKNAWDCSACFADLLHCWNGCILYLSQSWENAVRRNSSLFHQSYLKTTKKQYKRTLSPMAIILSLIVPHLLLTSFSIPILQRTNLELKTVETHSY